LNRGILWGACSSSHSGRFPFGEITLGHWIGAAKMKILPQPEIELQSSSISFGDRTITEKYGFTFSNSAF
jgi:hypothetical protein